MRSFAGRLFVSVLGFLCLTVALARGATWTGLAAPDNNWTTPGNWDSGVPGSGDTAIFDGPGNGNTTVSLGGGTRPLNTLFFDSANAAAYTIGQLPNDALSFSGGEIWVLDTVTNPQTINANVVVNGSLVTHNFVPHGSTGPDTGIAGLTFGNVNISNGTFYVTNRAATVTTVLNGNITETAGQPGSVQLIATATGAGVNSNFVINGNNTYTGGTTIQANTGTSGGIYIGSDSAFGTGKITTQTSANNAELRALGGARTLSNAIDLNQGLNFAGTNSIVLNGPIAIASGATRTLQNKISGGGTLTIGASAGSSSIYLGDPTTGAGSIIILGANTGSTTIVNALFQDVGSGSAVRYGTQNGGNIIINVPQTYTSDTQIGGGEANVQFKHDYNVGDPSGPFGLGRLHANAATNSRLTPIQGDRTIANPILMEFGLAFNNVSGDTSSVTFTGPIRYTSALGGGGNRRVINNLMGAAGGTVTFGSATNPSTFTLEAANGQGVNFTGSGRTTINHTIQDSVPNVNNPITVSNSSTTTFNGPQITDGDFQVTGGNSTVIINGPRTSAGGSTPATVSITGANAKLFVNSTMTGLGAVSITASGSTLGGTGSISGTVTNDGRIAPGTPAGVPGTLTLTGNVTNNTNSRWLIGLDGATASKLVIGGDLNLSAVDSLDVIGAGSGSSWVIATYGGTLTGTFDNVTAGYAVDYGTGMNSQITLMAVAAGVAGDFNNDGLVDAADYVLWRKNEGSNNALPNDDDLGTPINQAHYDLWRSNFGNGAGGGALSAAAVPEPAAALLLLGTIGGYLAMHARRRGTMPVPGV